MTAAKATLALNAAECVRLVLLVISWFLCQHYRRLKAQSEPLGLLAGSVLALAKSTIYPGDFIVNQGDRLSIERCAGNA
ncbi:MAG: hypothetical protein WCZ88_16690 [Pigmentiphaga sp.]